MKFLLRFVLFMTVLALNTAVIFAATNSEDKNEINLKLTGDELRWLNDHPKPRIGVWINVPPYAFPDSNGEPQGIFPDYIKEIERILNSTFQIVSFPSFAAAWEKAINKEVDLLVAVTPSEKHLKYMNLSHTYHVVPIVLVTRTDMPFVSSIREFNGKKVVVGKGHVTEQWIKRDYPDIQLIPIDDYENGLRLVSEGKADAYAAAMGALTWQIKKHRITNLKIATKSPYEYKLSIAVRKDWPEFIPIIEKALSSIEKSKQDSIYDKWVTVSFEEGIDWIFVWKIIFIIIAFSTAVLLIILIWNRRLKREIIERKKVEEVLKINEQFLNETGQVAKVGGWGSRCRNT